MSKLPPTSNYLPLLRYHLQRSRTSTPNPQFPGPPLPGIYLLRSLYTQDLFSIRPIRSHIDVLGPPWTLQEPLQGSHLSIPATTRSFPSSVAVSVAPFELQPAPSTLQRKLLIPNPS
ncbi:hypothetical protein C8J55DRAFT_565412 [Lentinula edodes]|uniref:Uncharacterized protein n=1 Tax=Lentinula lateritia TaxID=40482 RepID=A0A9W9DEY3_9AGAR|nr:hypothetical protein C8J55DRAFT_565412 [Lentinula edodes]